MTRKYLGLGLFVILLIVGRAAFADENLAGFGHISSPGEAAAGPWGPVPTENVSLVNLAPVLLPYFNNGPVFGMPGTVVGDFWHNTQLSGDWGGLRTDLARHGLFFDLYSTSVYQDVMSGGLKTGSAFVQNTQVSINLDTGRAGLWPGGLFHFTLQVSLWSLAARHFYGRLRPTPVYRVTPAGASLRKGYSSVGILS